MTDEEIVKGYITQIRNLRTSRIRNLKTRIDELSYLYNPMLEDINTSVCPYCNKPYIYIKDKPEFCPNCGWKLCSVEKGDQA